MRRKQNGLLRVAKEIDSLAGGIQALRKSLRRLYRAAAEPLLWLTLAAAAVSRWWPEIAQLW